MTTTTLRWGILGTGGIARTFALALPRSRRGRLQAVASRDAARARAFAQAHGAATAHGGVRALAADPAVDAVYIATPHPLHAQEAIACLQAGKHVLVEKPMATTVGDAEAMVAAAVASGRTLLEAFMYRVHPQTTRLRQILARGDIGSVRVIRSTFTYGLGEGYNVRIDRQLCGGALWDVGCYCIHASRMVAQAEPLAVHAEAWIEPGTGVDAHTVGLLRFPGGIVAHFDCGIRSAGGSLLEIEGSQGRITLGNPWKPRADRAAFRVEDRRGAREEVITDGGDIYAVEADHLAAVVAGEVAESPISAAQGLANTRVLAAMHRALFG